MTQCARVRRTPVPYFIFTSGPFMTCIALLIHTFDVGLSRVIPGLRRIWDTWSYGAPVSSHVWLNAGGGLRPWHVLRQPRKDPRSWRRAVCCNPWATDPYLEHLELRSYGVPSHGTRFASQANIHDHVAAQCAATPGLRNPWELMRYSFLGVTHAMRPSCNNNNNHKDKR